MAYCFCCYLFRKGVDDDKFGYEVFTKIGFKQWKNAYLILRKHVGGPNSAHNRAHTAFEDLAYNLQGILYLRYFLMMFLY
jgi:hypothetical protein